MADEDRNRDEAMGDETTPSTRNTERDQTQNREAGGSNKSAEQDDVAEDRNLSGSSTWLTLPDQQPATDDESENS